MNEQWQELKETIIELRDNDGTLTQQEACKFLANLMDVLEKQMSCSENLNKWIPVSERLPKEDGKYLVSRKNEENIWVEEAYYSTTSRTTFPKGFSIIKDNFSWRINNVIAWMPLPQPYKAESEGAE